MELKFKALKCLEAIISIAILEQRVIELFASKEAEEALRVSKIGRIDKVKRLLIRASRINHDLSNLSDQLANLFCLFFERVLHAVGNCPEVSQHTQSCFSKQLPDRILINIVLLYDLVNLTDLAWQSPRALQLCLYVPA